VISKYHWTPLIGLGAILFVVGAVLRVVGRFLRTVVGLHATWLVNSATHMWGSRRSHLGHIYNSFWVAILTFGEGWHTITTQREAARHGLPGMKST